MKETHLEILLMTGTSFSSRQSFEKNGEENSYQVSDKEELVEACWNGLVKEILPEIWNKTENGNKLFLWKINEATFFIDLEWGENPDQVEKNFSINPYFFLQNKILQ